MKINNAILIFFLFLNGCSTYQGDFLVRFWDGYYSLQNSAKEYDRKEREFYANETLEKKLLRKNNHEKCLKLSDKLFLDKITKYKNNKEITKRTIYIQCMGVNNTFIYPYANNAELDWLEESEVQLIY